MSLLIFQEQHGAVSQVVRLVARHEECQEEPVLVLTSQLRADERIDTDEEQPSCLGVELGLNQGGVPGKIRGDGNEDLQRGGGEGKFVEGDCRDEEVLSTHLLTQNLIKGDMGHLLGRNHSEDLLETKISKLKAVTNDQLKRVSLAYAKDKD